VPHGTLLASPIERLHHPWLSLRPLAQLAGGAWLAAGLIYGAIRTKGFRRDLVAFEAPPE
jgi:hypothetical protein